MNSQKIVDISSLNLSENRFIIFLISMNTPQNVSSYTLPVAMSRATNVRVRINGVSQTVGATQTTNYLCAAWNGAVEIGIECDAPIENCAVRPRSRNVSAQIESNIARFTLENPQNISIEIDDMKPLFLFANQIEDNAPSPDDADVLYFRAGETHQIGKLQLRDNQTLYIEGGAVVRGCVRAKNAKNVRICGHGVLDGSLYTRDIDARMSIILEGCHNARVENITMIEPSVWMLVVGNCDGVQIENVHQIGEVMTSDGVDIVGSRNVTIRNCFQRNNDDCIAIKAVNYHESDDDNTVDWRQNVENILVEGCVFSNDRGGSAVEIGYETQCDSMKNITFRNCDVLSVHGSGAVFAIHNGDRALVENVTYEDFRIEHHYDKLIDFRVLDSVYRRDETLGQVRNITLRDIQVYRQSYNAGYTISVIGGFDAEHTIENVVIENFYFDDVKITDADALDLYLKQARNIEFR